jgi:SNF2 family DNA or RNA helicase
LHGQGNDAELINTIRHEVAHAIVGPGHGHNEVWADKAREIGCDNTLPCANVSLKPELIDAIRSGATIEVEFTEQVIRTPHYKVTRLQDRCIECGEVAKEKFSFEDEDIEGNFCKFIYLECGHVKKLIIPRATPFESLVSNWWKDEVSTCEHEWNTSSHTKCEKCGEFRLYPFQVEGARFIETALATGKGAGIFDEMGLGKTVQSLAYIRYHQELTPVLFIVKSGIKFQWFTEILRWLSLDFTPQIIETSRDFIIPRLKAYIISYDLLRRMSQDKIDKIAPKLVILDECQQIKNADSTRTQEVRKIIRNQEVKVIPLSGTPWKNRGSEFFPVLNMLDPTKFNSHQGFINRWVDRYWEGNRLREGGIKHPARFKEYVKDIIIRRERQEVMKQLPVISRTKLNVQLEEIEQKAYDDEVSEFVEWYNEFISEGHELDGMQLMAKMARMRHITGLSKIPATLEFVNDFVENTERKIVVFVHHKDVGSILYDRVKENHGTEMPVLKLSADLDSEARHEVQKTFNESPRAILIASTLAAGEGLNLQTCADCIMHERQWNPQNEEQAEGRFIRIGQQSNTVNATYVEADDTIDAHIAGLVEKKRRAFHAVMNKGELPRWNESAMAKELADIIAMRFMAKNRKKTNG